MVNRKEYWTLIVCLFFLPGANADSLRCGNSLVSTGDSKAEIILKCGQPLFQETIAIEEKSDQAALALKYPLLYKHGLLKDRNGAIVSSSKTVTQKIDQWTYHMGQGKFLRILHFEGGELVAISSGDRM